MFFLRLGTYTSRNCLQHVYREFRCMYFKNNSRYKRKKAVWNNRTFKTIGIVQAICLKPSIYKITVCFQFDVDFKCHKDENGPWRYHKYFLIKSSNINKKQSLFFRCCCYCEFLLEYRESCCFKLKENYVYPINPVSTKASSCNVYLRNFSLTS